MNTIRFVRAYYWTRFITCGYLITTYLLKRWFILNLLYSTILMKQQSFIIGVLVIKFMYFSYLFKNYFS